MWDVDEDVARARTPPAELYRSRELFDRARERVFARAWHWVGTAGDLAAPGALRPLTLAPGLLDEPVLLARGEDGELRALSNACTHRGMLVCEAPGAARELRCRYHGRRFALDGALRAAPGFEGAAAFPRPADDLPRLDCESLGAFRFVATRPAVPFDAWSAAAAALGLGAHHDWVPDPDRSREYHVAAHWALYVENYLEGLHVPFVHRGLAAALDVGAYAVEPLEHGVLQTGVASGGGVAARYLWTFPNLMWNVYPWGLSVNVVEPLDVDATRVRFLAYVRADAPPADPAGGAGDDLHGVELEDERVVEAVARGLRSRSYGRGRYAPRAEAGVHRFHRLLVAALRDG